ncbi:MAG: sodium:proton antiporter, partial [Desulfobacterales bacterium]|nr:sodium:proton antiporter [Desulfobacterales bacterium]
LAAPMFFDMTLIEAGILGFIVAAVSPAVVVPSMIKFMDKKRGTDKGIPTMILASSSLDNAYVIVV